MAAKSENENDDLARKYDERYLRYGKPLEVEHMGEFLAISPQGEMVFGTTRAEVAHRARTLGQGVFLYRIGHSAVGQWL
jgi:hypothetical protein